MKFNDIKNDIIARENKTIGFSEDSKLWDFATSVYDDQLVYANAQFSNDLGNIYFCVFVNKGVVEACNFVLDGNYWIEITIDYDNIADAINDNVILSELA